MCFPNGGFIAGNALSARKETNRVITLISVSMVVVIFSECAAGYEPGSSEARSYIGEHRSKVGLAGKLVWIGDGEIADSGTPSGLALIGPPARGSVACSRHAFQRLAVFAQPASESRGGMPPDAPGNCHRDREEKVSRWRGGRAGGRGASVSPCF